MFSKHELKCILTSIPKDGASRMPKERVCILLSRECPVDVLLIYILTEEGVNHASVSYPINFTVVTDVWLSGWRAITAKFLGV